VINTLFPINIACEVSNNNSNITKVHYKETQIIQNASKHRQREFLEGRNCAHLALAQLNFTESIAILIGENREPLWPDQMVGSITHCDNYCAAAVTDCKKVLGIGIDAELNKKLPNNLILTTQTKNEINLNKGLILENYENCINKLVFSAKESAFKFIYPFIQHYINFKDLEVRLDFDSKSFSIVFLTSELKSKFKQSNIIGKFDYNKTHTVTCVYELVDN